MLPFGDNFGTGALVCVALRHGRVPKSFRSLVAGLADGGASSGCSTMPSLRR